MKDDISLRVIFGTHGLFLPIPKYPETSRRIRKASPPPPPVLAPAILRPPGEFERQALIPGHSGHSFKTQKSLAQTAR